uniref:Cubilin n=1 Tax=Callorhinchus milii TaxID=7868 RepID=A0A4W3K7X0_CALMI
MPTYGHFTWLLFVMFIFCTLTCESENDSKTHQKRDISNSQPRMTSEDGNLIFHPGDLKNIEFRTLSSGAIKLNNKDLEEALKQITMNKDDITQLQINGSGIPQNISSQINLLSDKVSTPKSLYILQTRTCSSNPCHNGGICMDLLNSFYCLCPNNWKGSTCTDDVDECQIYVGTPLGCQNGATCYNTKGNYSCQCNPEWYGLQCTSKHDDCQGTSKDLCEHGICIDLNREQPDQPMYRCICDAGWEQASGHQACSVDIDECSLLDGPCSKTPPVNCTNTEGSYSCGDCPAGWRGNGHSCQDVNECETSNGGCSQDPMVLCLNTMGSFHCGSCPPGYEGDGKVCTTFDICSVNNGGCAPNASCTPNAGNNFPTCQCPPELIGNGYGPNGCIPAEDICEKLNPCVNGECTVSVCICHPGWTGINCDQNTNECASNPCQNGGTCSDHVNGYFCRCPAEWTGPQCQIEQEVCGKRLSGLNGTFSYPDGKEQYGIEVNCVWVITTDLDKVLRITFPLFQLEESTGCVSDFLEVRDGDSLSSNRIGSYCGNTIPEEIISSHNSLYLWFSSDHSVVKDGFTVVWESTDPECGGHFNETRGIINSPGYPGNYPPNRDCYWTISVPTNLVITFTFGLLNIENHDTCNSDFLEIQDGLHQDDPSLQKYCSTVETPAPLVTTGPFARIHFHSDGNISDRGFSIVYITSPLDTGCGGIYTESEWIIISPNWPNPYPSNVQCIYVIRQPSGERIDLNITHMDLASNCSLDYVEVRDGDSETDPLIGKFCGSTIPAVITTSRNNLWIKFKSSDSFQKGGFRAIYQVACGGTLSGTGVIRSPYYPNAYPPDKTCTWIINQPEGQVVTLNFVSFDIDDAANCTHDYVEVRDGADVESPLIDKYCGAGNPPMAQSGRRSMYIKFKTDSSTAKEGFSAEYGSTKKGCGDTITDPQGDISSPNHPVDYPHDVSCIWFISVQPGNVVRLTFTLFNLEYHENCTKDYVELYDRGTVNSGKLLGRYCGTSIPPSITSSDNSMSVLFVSDSSIATEGFSASYVSIESSTVCTKEFTESTGSLTSPNYPNDYPSLVECIYTITVKNNKQIRLNFTDFELDGYSDYVEIRNGGYETSNLIGTFSETAPPLILSHSNRLWIKFSSNSFFEKRGFMAHWDGTSTGCGGTLTTSTGSFTSPNYPMPYPHNTECYWRIQINAGSIIELDFDAFHLDSISGCSYDYLAVYDGNSTNSYLLATLCGNQKPTTIRSTSNNMYIKLRTDNSIGRGGFFAKYKSNCQNVIIANHSRGVLESINFPEDYPPEHNCNWTIQATEGNTIDYSFNAFDLDSTYPSCYFTWLDYLFLYDGPNDKSPLIGTFCDQTIPPAGTSNSSSLHVVFCTELSYSSAAGFQMLWLQNGCGGDLFGPNGAVSSPGFPNWYPHNRECLWFLHVDEGNSIEFTIHEFDVEYHKTCNFDVLEVYAGPDTRSPRLAQLCNTRLPNNPLVISSTGNAITVRFKSNSKGNGKGFNATWKEKPGGCGGNFVAPKGEIHSPNFPNPYGNNVDCSWVITVDTHYRVFLNFTDFDTENRQSCDSAYIAVHDGSNQGDPLIEKICDGKIPGGFTSTSNVMYVHFLSESNVKNKGFRAQFNQVCGTFIVTDNIGGVITSPLYPNNYPDNQNCSWIIQAQEPFKHVTLSFTDFAIESNGKNCSTDALQILDGDNYEAPPIGRYCGATILQPITSESNALVVNFVSNSGKSDKGFRTTYAASNSACGGSYHSETGAFNSPNYPESYPSNYECVWNLIGSPGNRVQLSFISFQIADSSSCDSDYVEIREGNATGQIYGKFCGTSLPKNYTSVTGHILWVKFVSDSSQNDAGFKATFSHLYGNEIMGTQGQITSPLWPHHYPNNARYHWTITAPEGNIIHVKILVMDIDDLLVCFYDGPDVNSRLIVTYCGYEPPPPVVSFGTTLTIEFSSDDSSNGQGFLLEWHAQQYTINPTAIPTIPPGACGGNVMTGESPAFLYSPGWPNEYQTHLNCMWVIWSPRSTVELNIMALDIESADSKCSLDSLVIRDGDDSLSPVLATLCGKELPGPIRSTGEAMFIQFIADTANSGGGFNASYHKMCGGLLHADRGVITSPNYPQPYTANLNCTWHVLATSGSIISLHFEKLFEVQASGSSCSNGDYLEFRNGYDSSSPPLTSSGGNGRYCGEVPPSTMRTTDNRLSVRFISDGSSEGQGFKFTYEASYMACGATIYVSDFDPVGNISSMNYPNNYPQNIDCTWTITVPAGEAVQLDFEDLFYIEPDSQCAFDYLELHDGPSSNSPLISRLCGSTSPSTQKSTGNVMHVRFRTDARTTHAGFKARYSIARCGGTLIGIDGYLQSPGYPSSNYPDNVQCEWYLKGPTGHYLTITYDALDLEDTPNCTKDFVEIREYSSTGRLLGKHCGSTTFDPMDTSDSFAYVRFHTDASNNKKGFRLGFEASVDGCGGELTASTGTITSPNYPNLYPHSRRCVWKITVQEGRRVTLSITDLHLEAHENCDLDFVAIYNGLQPNSPRLQKYCGNLNSNVSVMSSGNTMQLVFVTDALVSNGGFSATYTSEEDAVCGGTLGDPNEGTFTSPGYNGKLDYMSNLNCEWLIQNPSSTGSSIYIEFINFHLEHHTLCEQDHVAIRSENSAGELLVQLCGELTPGLSLVIANSQVWVHFMSNPSVEDIGFNAKYRFTECGGIQTGSTGRISSPNFPSPYTASTHCAWLLEAPEGHTISLSFTVFELEPHSACTVDSVTIKNGGSSSSPIIGQYCGTNSPGTIKSGSNRLLVIFNSNNTVPHKGFDATWTSDSAGCGGILHADDGSFDSPNWPVDFPKNSECTWKIVAHRSKHLELSFDDNFLIPDNSGHCEDSYVKVWAGDAEQDGTLLTTACGDVPPSLVTIPANVMTARFRSADSVGKGFSASFTRCGANFTDLSGLVMSPNYPHNYDINMNCEYFIDASKDMFVILQFEAFALEDGFKCEHDALKIYSETTATSDETQLLITLCGSVLPATISVHGPMLLTFQTNNMTTDMGFLAKYHLVPCGGTFQESSGVVTSPAYSYTNYNHKINCTYHIIVRENRLVELKFSDFDLELLCSDYVSVHDGSNIFAPSLGKFCGSTIPPPLLSSSNSMFIVFTTDIIVSGRGWKALYVETLGPNQGCGGYLNSTSGTFGSPDMEFDGKYEKNLNCLWNISAPDNHFINITFTAFQLEAETDGVCHDYLSIYDESSKLIGTYCGSQLPFSVVSTYNLLAVKFFSNAFIELAGFNVTYKTHEYPCGGKFKANSTSQILTSPEYPNNYPPLTICHWIIDAPENEQVGVVIQELDLPATPNCSLEYLEIKDSHILGDNGQNIRLCGSNLIIPAFYSYGHRFRINFYSKVYQNGNKLHLTYQSTNCSREYNQSFGYLKSPGWPAEYPNNLNCKIILRAPKNHKISLFFNAFYLELQKDCKLDYLEVHNGTPGHEQAIGKFCGYHLPNPIFSHTHELTLIFKSDAISTYAGFEITWTSSLNECGGTLYGPSGSFYSPNYPEDHYDNTVCEWIIQAPVGRVITFNFPVLSIDGECKKTYLNFYDGVDSSSKLIKSYCETDTIATFTSSSSNVFVKFHAEDAFPSSKFRILWTS